MNDPHQSEQPARRLNQTAAGAPAAVGALSAPEEAYRLSREAVISSLRVDPVAGLPAAEVRRRQEALGLNELAQPPPVPAWRRLLRQFSSLVIWILVAAAIVSGALGELADSLAILAIVLLNGILGFVQEEKAERSLEALRRMSTPEAKVLRDGRMHSVAAAQLVPGDCIEVEAGDNAPADARLLEAYALRTQEAPLTGESTPVDKDPGWLAERPAPLGDRRNMLYMGTVVAAGKATAVVTATGMQTELGRIAGMLGRTTREPTPLERRLDELGRVLVVVCLALVGLIFVLEMLREGDLLQVFLLSVSLAVAAVPEGLPAVVTLALALGLQRMVRRNALVRKLPSVETLGSVTVICTDKTGTLTRNEMTVRQLVVGSTRYDVTGSGYAPQGEFYRRRDDSGAWPPHDAERIDPHDDEDLVQALTVAARCNHATVVPAKDAARGWQVIGDPTEGALLVAAMKAGIDPDRRATRVIHEIPFDSERKAMSVVVRRDGGAVMYTKGATEVLLARCSRQRRDGRVVPLDDATRRQIDQLNAAMAQRALRVLALAYREFDVGQREFPEEDLVLAGLVGMIDPPRAEAQEAVRRCHQAGIRPVMITGDHPATARAIARELEIAGPGDEVLTGVELDELSDEALVERVEHVAAYARVSAAHKLRVIQAWRARGAVVAMTGDGVNDAPAVRSADIGIAMGLTGTDVTKEASDMVLTDDNFASIVHAVEEGRCIYDNIQKVLLYLLSCNAGEILLMLAASLLGWPLPLLPVQLLWVNLVTDGLPALALSTESPEPGIMRRRPRSSRQSLLNWQLGRSILFQGVLVGGSALAAFAIVLELAPGELGRARTTAFCTLVYCELLRALAARSQTLTLGQLGLSTNPALLGAIALSGLLQLTVVTLPYAQGVFESARHFAWEWTVIVPLSLVPVSVLEIAKLVGRARSGGEQAGAEGKPR